ncbi:Peptide deformylase 1 [compost metagenome]
MEIITYPNDILREKCQLIKQTDKDIIQQLHAIKKWAASPESGAAGLALPQIGIAKQGFVFHNLFTDTYEIVINPKILKKSGTQASNEGCLSIPGEEAMITRFKEIEVIYQMANLKSKKVVLRNKTAAIFQHEFDHLHGKLYIDYLKEV